MNDNFGHQNNLSRNEMLEELEEYKNYGVILPYYFSDSSDDHIKRVYEYGKYHYEILFEEDAMVSIISDILCEHVTLIGTMFILFYLEGKTFRYTTESQSYIKKCRYERIQKEGIEDDVSQYLESCVESKSDVILISKIFIEHGISISNLRHILNIMQN